MSYLTSIAAAGITESIVAGIFGVYTLLTIFNCYLNIVQIELDKKQQYPNKKCPKRIKVTDAKEGSPYTKDNLFKDYNIYQHSPSPPPPDNKFHVSAFINGGIEQTFAGLDLPILNVTRVVVYFSNNFPNIPLLVYFNGTITPPGQPTHHWYKNTGRDNKWVKVEDKLDGNGDLKNLLKELSQITIECTPPSLTTKIISFVVIILLFLILYAFFKLPAPSTSSNTKEWIVRITLGAFGVVFTSIAIILLCHVTHKFFTHSATSYRDRVIKSAFGLVACSSIILISLVFYAFFTISTPYSSNTSDWFMTTISEVASGLSIALLGCVLIFIQPHNPDGKTTGKVIGGFASCITIALLCLEIYVFYQIPLPSGRTERLITIASVTVTVVVAGSSVLLSVGLELYTFFTQSFSTTADVTNITSGVISVVVIALLCLALYIFYRIPTSSSTSTGEWITRISLGAFGVLSTLIAILLLCLVTYACFKNPCTSSCKPIDEAVKTVSVIATVLAALLLCIELYAFCTTPGPSTSASIDRLIKITFGILIGLVVALLCLLLYCAYKYNCKCCNDGKRCCCCDYCCYYCCKECCQGGSCNCQCCGTAGGNCCCSKDKGCCKGGKLCCLKCLLKKIAGHWLGRITSGVATGVSALLLCLVLYTFFQLPAPSSSTKYWAITIALGFVGVLSTIVSIGLSCVVAYKFFTHPCPWENPPNTDMIIKITLGFVSASFVTLLSLVLNYSCTPSYQLSDANDWIITDAYGLVAIISTAVAAGLLAIVLYCLCTTNPPCPPKEPDVTIISGVLTELSAALLCFQLYAFSQLPASSTNTDWPITIISGTAGIVAIASLVFVLYCACTKSSFCKLPGINGNAKTISGVLTGVSALLLCFELYIFYRIPPPPINTKEWTIRISLGLIGVVAAGLSACLLGLVLYYYSIQGPPNTDWLEKIALWLVVSSSVSLLVVECYAFFTHSRLSIIRSIMKLCKRAPKYHEIDLDTLLEESGIMLKF